ncbi:pilus assembly protein TadG-related protein [Streptomyces sp. CGMCC 4.7035]|uniref:pilus assembly protein TadG-related protein n=1 Tax=Streptomyces sp. CGMCC 4.7035 TaxID=3061628 RepID=UPI002873B880|nr:pilus assembly protein TadG-related protein [Streptomyces sp. CGMCC 4.7035]WNC03018.1 pilus assembly protein TadG-related protein [Streptomyces sp. CGMCC 4.7035]
MDDRGQTLPIYIWLTGILLFAAVAFFVFAQAASARNGAQSAADAAALAAAQDSRDELMTDLQDAVGHEDDWLDWLDGKPPANAGADAAARRLAGENDATVLGVQQVMRNGYPGFQVDVQTNYTVGKSIIPGTESKHAKAQAIAVIEPRCTFAQDADPKKLVQLDCDGQVVDIDPEDFHSDDLPDASVLFSVHLAE